MSETMSQRPQSYATRVAASTAWCFGVWVLLTWTLTAEVLVVGLVVSLVAATALAPLGPVVAPWRLVSPRRAGGALIVFAVAVPKIITANVVLARRIWTPHMPLSTGMVVVPTMMRSEGGIAAVGLITSLIVDNQVIDVDAERHELLFHAIVVPSGGRAGAYDAINGPVERAVRRMKARQ